MSVVRRLPSSNSKKIRRKSSSHFLKTGSRIFKENETFTESLIPFESKNLDLLDLDCTTSDSDDSAEHYIFTPHKIYEKENRTNVQKTPLTKDIVSQEKVSLPLPVSTENKASGKKSSTMNLQEMAEKILEKLTIILHDNCLYYYNHKYYQIIGDWEDLLEIVRSEISYDAFDSISLKRFSDLFTYMRVDKRLIPKHYEEQIQKSSHYVTFQNGVLDVKKMKLYSHSPKYLTFYMLDAYWNASPQATHFKKFLQDTSGGDSEIILRILESMGYLLSSVNTGKYFFVMGNAPNSGKSVLGTFLQKVLGQKLVTNKSIYQLSERFALGDIQGKLLNLSMDLPNGKLSAPVVSIIKQISGGDTISVQKKYDKMREVSSNMRFLFASNYPVTIPKDDDNEAFWDRMIVIPFLYSIERSQADAELLNKLLQEKDDIISTCILALGKVIRNHYMFSPCTSADNLKQSWRYREYDQTQSIPIFVKYHLEVTGDPTDKIYMQDLYQKYINFCVEYELPTANQNSFSSWLLSNLEGCYKKRIHKTGKNPLSGLIGIRLKENNNQ